MSETNLRILVEEISRIFSADSVVGEPIIQEDKVLIPFMKMGFALGAGTGSGSNKGEGTGVAGGGGIQPVALVAVYQGVSGAAGVDVLPMKSPSRVPDIVEKAIDTMSTKMEQMEPGTVSRTIGRIRSTVSGQEEEESSEGTTEQY